MVSIGPWIIDITLEKQYLDSCLSKATKSFSVPDFSSMLKLVLDGLSHSSISKKHVSLLVDLSNNLIHHAPEGTLFVFALLTPSAHIWIGTLKLTQAHFTHCLGLFVNNPIYLEDIILRTRILRLIERQVNDRVRRYLLINLRLFSPFPSPPQFVLRIFRISGPYLVNCLRARASTRLTQIRTFIGTSFRFSTHWFAYAEILSSLRFLIWASCYDVSLFLSSHFHHNLEGSKRDSWLVHYLAGSTRHTHWAWKKARQLRGCLLPLPPRLSYEPMGHQNFRRLNPLHGHSLNMHLRF